MVQSEEHEEVRKADSLPLTLPPVHTDIHTAARLELAGRAVQIPGVEVFLRGDRVTVFIPSLRGPEADTVFALEGEIYRAYPGARLNLEVDEIQDAAAAARAMDQRRGDTTFSGVIST